MLDKGFGYDRASKDDFTPILSSPHPMPPWYKKPWIHIELFFILLRFKLRKDKTQDFWEWQDYKRSKTK